MSEDCHDSNNMKTREWWIEFTGNPRNDKEKYKRYVGGKRFTTISPSDEVIHVIEYSAYEKSIKDAERYCEGEQFYRREWESACERVSYAQEANNVRSREWWVEDAVIQRAVQRDQKNLLTECEAALEHIMESNNNNSAHAVARQTLAKIRKALGE